MADTYTVERSRVIEAPIERVYAQVADFHHWTAWSPWEDLDPDMQRTYAGADAGPGAIYTWRGNRKAGTGRMEITDATAPTTVEIDLVFEKPWKSRSTTAFSLQPQGEATEVTWTMTGPHSTMTKVMGFFISMDTMLGKDFEKGLGRLKKVAESSA